MLGVRLHAAATLRKQRVATLRKQRVKSLNARKKGMTHKNAITGGGGSGGGVRKHWGRKGNKTGTLKPPTARLKVELTNIQPLPSLQRVGNSTDPMTWEWYYLDGNGQNSGPVTLVSFKKMLTEEIVCSETMLWAEELGKDWCELSKVITVDGEKLTSKPILMHKNPMDKN